MLAAGGAVWAPLVPRPIAPIPTAPVRSPIHRPARRIVAIVVPPDVALASHRVGRGALEVVSRSIAGADAPRDAEPPFRARCA
jgi:hypothetical protein